jgi:hypothetical protein
MLRVMISLTVKTRERSCTPSERSEQHSCSDGRQKRKDQHDSDPRESKIQGRDDYLQLMNNGAVFSLHQKLDRSEQRQQRLCAQIRKQQVLHRTLFLEQWMYQQSL